MSDDYMVEKSGDPAQHTVEAETDYQTVRTALVSALAFWPHLSPPQKREINAALDALERIRDDARAQAVRTAHANAPETQRVQPQKKEIL